MKPTYAEVMAALDYDPETGHFTWKVRLDMPRQWNTRWAGTVVGTLTAWGYIAIVFNGVAQRAHRLAWLVMKKKWPTAELDHRNGIRHDNRWRNLREATNVTNQYNQGCHRDNSTGFKGVYPMRDKFAARIKVDKKRIFMGSFATPQDAHAAYSAAARKYHGEFARTE